MSSGCEIDIVDQAFRQAREQFNAMILQLHTAPTAQMHHDDVISLIKALGTEIMRLALQGHLDIRCAREEPLCANMSETSSPE